MEDITEWGCRDKIITAVVLLFCTNANREKKTEIHFYTMKILGERCWEITKLNSFDRVQFPLYPPFCRFGTALKTHYILYNIVIKIHLGGLFFYGRINFPAVSGYFNFDYYIIYMYIFRFVRVIKLIEFVLGDEQ